MTSRAVIEEFWQRFLFVRGLPQSARWQDCFHFETTPAGAEHALGLVLQGIKRATFTSLHAFQQRGLRPPKRGDLSIVTQWDGVPRCVIQTVGVLILPYGQVSAEQALSEGEDSTLEGWRILREAKRQGYQAAKGQMQQLPLTLILDKDGTVLFCHYGASLTDVPTDCEAMQSLLEELELVPDMPELENLDCENFPELEDADELEEEFDTFH